MRVNYAEDIKRAVPMREVAELYGLQVNRAGFTCCPFHAEKTASMKIYPGARGFACYGCGEHGSVIDFVMQYLNLTYHEACERLNGDFRLGLPMGDKLDLRAEKKARERNRERQARLEAQHIVYDARDEAQDIWCACDLILTFAPVMSEDWCKAKKYIDIATYYLDCAEEVVAEYERQRDNKRNCAGLDG